VGGTSETPWRWLAIRPANRFFIIFGSLQNFLSISDLLAFLCERAAAVVTPPFSGITSAGHDADVVHDQQRPS